MAPYDRGDFFLYVVSAMETKNQHKGVFVLLFYRVVVRAVS